MRASNFLALIAIASSHALAEEIFQERASNWTVGQTVQTTSGPVNGHAATNQSEVSEYLGIPYGIPPIGDLRWTAPQRFEGNTTLNGSSFGNSCSIKGTGGAPTYSPLQIAAANATNVGVAVLDVLSNPVTVYSEDCLYLNVWTKPQVGDKKKAVLVWIYGGGFNSGTSSVPGYNGANWAELEDVVLVSFNYRLSIFGFPGNPSGTNNLGLLDQRLAVEWVRDNIENFGGDPSRITLFGQSAGGASVDFYSYAWASDPIAAGFIPESGNTFSWGLPNSKTASSGAWYTVAHNLGCGNASSDPEAVTACMRTKTTAEIFLGIPAASLTAGILGYFGPTVDDKVVLSNYSTAKPANVPMLIGNNDYEAGLFRTEFALSGLFLSDTFWTDFNLQEFTCPCSLRANASLAAKVPTWRYRYMGVFPDLAVSSEAGTWHAAEVPLLFDTAPTVVAATPEEISIGNYMRGAWATFAKDPQKGLLTYEDGWPLYDPAHDTLVRLAYNNITGANLINPYRYDADCPFVNTSSTDPSKDPALPDLGINVTPTGSAGVVSATGTATKSGSATGTGTGATASSTNHSGASRLGASVWVVLGAAGMAYLL